MATDFFARCDTIEECYEFMLAYAGQGLPTDVGSQSGSQVRQFLQGAVIALTGLAESCSKAATELGLEPGEKYQAFASVIGQDAQASQAALELVLAQSTISSQLIDNLNASIHVRAVLTDLFLIDEILTGSRNQENPAGAA